MNKTTIRILLNGAIYSSMSRYRPGVWHTYLFASIEEIAKLSYQMITIKYF